MAPSMSPTSSSRNDPHRHRRRQGPRRRPLPAEVDLGVSDPWPPPACSIWPTARTDPNSPREALTDRISLESPHQRAARRPDCHIGLFSKVSFNRDGTQLASAGADGTVDIWALDLDDLIAIVQREFTCSVSDDEAPTPPACDCLPASLTREPPPAGSVEKDQRQSRSMIRWPSIGSAARGPMTIRRKGG
jgi:hypothetical protein